MIVLLFLLISLCASHTWGQEFVCGFGLTSESASAQAATAYRKGTIQPLILLGKFNGVLDKDLFNLEAV